MPGRGFDQRHLKVLIGIFAAVVGLHVWLATRNLSVEFMLGHEFRQTQTAITSYYIDRENNFSLLYETPIVGKPWVSILMEVPLYEWSVVLLRRATGLKLVTSARVVSLACFYLSLPAFYLLLRQLGAGRAQRLGALILILCCPVYLFYSRAFLMDSMEVMCCAWFLYGYIRMMQQRRWTWFLLATVAGTGAALIKGVTLAVWLPPAAAYVAWRLWREIGVRRSWSEGVQTAFWGLAGVTVPLGALRLWIELTDPIKAAHASAWIFTSRNLSEGNWGLIDLAARVSPQTWYFLLDRWREAVMPPWVIGAALIAALLVPSVARKRVAGVASLFFLAQLMFPFAYAYQDYYFYACAPFLVGGLGLALPALWNTGLPRWACWALFAVLPLAELHTYWGFYRPEQLVRSEGGFPFTRALRDLTPPHSVIVGAGADWAAIVPYYSQRKALLIRNGLENNHAYLRRALAELGDEDVTALVLLREQRTNAALRDLVARTFDLESTPTFQDVDADVYCSRRISNQVKMRLRADHGYGALKVGKLDATPEQPGTFNINGGLARSSFGNITPAPVRARFKFAYSSMIQGAELLVSAHPDSDLWLHPPATATAIDCEFGMFPAAWEKEGDKTDGVEFVITQLLPDGSRHELFRQRLTPVTRPPDRARQHVSLPHRPVPGELLQFSTRPGGGYAYDWSYWGRIEVK